MCLACSPRPQTLLALGLATSPFFSLLTSPWEVSAVAAGACPLTAPHPRPLPMHTSHYWHRLEGFRTMLLMHKDHLELMGWDGFECLLPGVSPPTSPLHQRMEVLLAQSCRDSATPWMVASQAPLSMGFSRQEYWSGLPCPPPGDLPNPGIEPRSPTCRQILYYLSHQGRPV